MQDNSAIYKARALYYNLLANFFVPSKNLQDYLSLLNLVYLLKENSLDQNSADALEKISQLLDSTSNVALLEEYDDLFHNPTTKKVRLTASFYDEGVESGKKRVEMINFVGKTDIRRDEKNYFEYEDSVGFLFTFMSELCDKIANGETKYENTVHCVFSEILNDFVDEFAAKIYEHDHAVIFRELMIVLNSFVAFERLFLDVSKPIKKVKVEKTTCDVEEISEEELERRARNKALKALGPKKAEDESCSIEHHQSVETEI